MPESLDQIAERMKDVQYSSRTRFATDALQRGQRLRNVLRQVLEQVPDAVRRQDPWCRKAVGLASGRHYNIQHLIYRKKPYEHQYRDVQFGMSTMHAHWAAGLEDIRKTLSVKGGLEPPGNDAGFVTHDIHR